MKRGLLGICACVLAVSLAMWQREPVHAEEVYDIKSEEAQIELQEVLQEHPVMALVYLNDTYPVRLAPSYDAEEVVTVPSGQQVQIQGITHEEGEVWASVFLYYQEGEYQGYIPRRFLACSNEKLLEWEENYGLNVKGSVNRSDDGDDTDDDVKQFPLSYQDELFALKKAHPEWTFVKMNTGLDWDEVVENEMKDGRSLIHTSFPDYMHGEEYSPGWAYATEETLEYFMDPRNGLTEDWIFQFEQLTYNQGYHTEKQIGNLLSDTFMNSNVPGRNLTFANVFWTVGQELGISPFHLACRVYQEQGQGTSPLISGTYPGYEGYYNYFNIGASGKTNKEVIENGLARAKKEGWTDGYLSIRGGAGTISTGYILRGQDTLYLQKFDVDSTNGLYWHQYMQNICAPTSEAKNIRKAYANAGAIDNVFVFRIPVYNNMPDQCPYPQPPSPVTGIKLNLANKVMQPGTSYTLGLTITPADAKANSIVWSSSNTKVATVNENGVISAVANGKTTITVTVDKFNASCKLVVSDDPMVLNNPFSDVEVTSWYYTYVKYALDNGLMNGKGNDADGKIIFDPEGKIKREELVQILYSREGKPSVTYTNKFSDVANGKWYTDAILWAAENNIVAGKGSIYGVGQEISREELATMLYSYAKYKGYDTSARADLSGYSDADKVSSWAMDCMQWAVAKGVVKGNGSGIKPTNSAQRAEGATMLKALIEAYK